MAETIESFVSKLQEDGVQAGRKAADKIVEDARQAAMGIIQQANDESQRIIFQARQEADGVLRRSQTELAFAARDAMLGFSQRLSEAVSAFISRAVDAKLDDVDFLGRLLHELILKYAEADIFRTSSMEIFVSPQMQQKLTAWALKEIAADAKERKLPIVLKNGLKQSGFEYRVQGGTIECTHESIREALSAFVGPKLREILQQAGPEDSSGQEPS